MREFEKAGNEGQDAGLKSDRLYELIRGKICLLEYPPGMALREEALAAEFGVSRTPIRRILQQLEHEQLVVHSPGGGVIVTTIDLKQLKDVYAVRLKIAEFVGEMMSPRVPDGVIEALEEVRAACAAMREMHDVTQLGRLYNQFHNVMMETISNRPLRRIYDQLFHQTSRVWLDILPDLDWQQEVDVMHEEISDVIDQLQAGDMEAVARTRRKHMSMLLVRLNRYLGSADNQPLE